MSFVLTSTITVGQQPVGIAKGDLDGDGDVDLLITNFSDKQVSILLNNGAGTFAAAGTSPITIPVGLFGIAAGDLDGNGKLDFVVTTQSGGAVRALLGDGAAGFTTAPGSPISLTGTMTDIEVGDFNKDGKLDFVAIDGNNGFAHAYLGAGDGSFTAAGSALATGSLPAGVAIGDINGDGNKDFVVTAGGGQLQLFAGDGAGGFAAAALISNVGNSPRAVALGDLDGDGDLDAVVTTQTNDGVQVLLLDGSGGVTSSTFHSTGLNPEEVQIVDFNFDGKLDLAVASTTGNAVSLLVGDGAGGFGAATSLAAGTGTRALVTADFNGDGYVDLAAVNQNASGPNGSVSLYLTTGLDVRSSAADQAEGNGADRSFTFTVRRVGSTAGAVSVDWTVTGVGTNPANAADFQGGVLPSGTVNFAAGESSKTITVTSTGDGTSESDETFRVTLSNASGGFDILGATAQGILRDDDTPAALPQPTGGADFAMLDGNATSFSAGDGDDQVYALDGTDTVNGNTGNDTVNGGAGDDIVRGGQGADRVLGEYGNDRLFGDLGDDTVNGGPGSDTCQGGEGGDVVHGGRDDDVLLGDAGDDTLAGDQGADTLTGGAGADRFLVGASGGADRILDFSAAQGDRLFTYDGASWTVSQVGADTVVRLSDGTTVTLAGVATADLTAGWIV